MPSLAALSKNPMLSQSPLGAYTDAQYEGDLAVLQNDIAKRYANEIQKLGYTDEQGNVIPGSLEVEANRNMTEYERQKGLAAEGVTQESQRQGTLFSGYRGTQQGRAEFPWSNAMARTQTDLGLGLGGARENIAGLMGEYSARMQQLLGLAAGRRAAAITNNPPGPGGNPPGGGPPGGGPPAGGGPGEGEPGSTVPPVTPNTTGADPNAYGGVQSGLLPGDEPGAVYDYVPGGGDLGTSSYTPPVTPNTTGANPSSYGGVASPGTEAAYPYQAGPTSTPGPLVHPTPNTTGAEPNAAGGVQSGYQPGDVPGEIYPYVSAVQAAQADPATAAVVTLPVSHEDIATAAAKRVKNAYKGLEMTPEF
jgi:hypothetical protein